MLEGIGNVLLTVFGTLIVVGIIGIVGIMLLKLFGTQVEEVEEEKRLVIYRLGRFHDVVGPGLVILNRYLDRVKREITARSELKEYTVGTYFMHGTPFGYVLSFWRRVDLKEAAGNDREKLRSLAMYTDDEREAQMRGKLHEAFMKCVPIIERSHKLIGDSVGEKLYPVLPGVPECDRLMAMVLAELQQTLPTIGVFPDMRQSSVLTIKSLIVSPEIMAGFSDARSMSFLRQQFPDLSDEMLLHAISLQKGYNPHMTRLYIEGSGGAAVSTVRIDEDGDVQDVRVAPAGVQAAAAPAKPQPASSPLTDDDLTESDWKVLKPTPRAASGG